MKATWRTKFNALCAMNDGYTFITIKRCNDLTTVWLDEIISTANGNTVLESGKIKYEKFKNECLTYRELMNYSKNK